MARINTNVPAIVAQTNLRRAQADLQVSLERLATGLRINRGADDPAGLIVSENLRAEIAGAAQAIENSQRAINVVATSEGALNEVASLLIDIQELILEAANTGAVSDEEIRANQLQIDSAVESITRVANTTTFAGRALLNGGLDYILSGVDLDDLANVQVTGAKFGTRSSIPVEVTVTQSAQNGELQFRASATSSPATIELRGNEGVATLTFQSGATAASIFQAVNDISDATGVEAIYLNSANPASGVAFRSIGYGSDQFVSVLPLGGDTFAVTDPDGSVVTYDAGRDVAATVNGVLVTGRGLDVSFNSLTLDLELTLQEDFALSATSRFDVTGGGALFQLGPEINSNQQEGLGVQSVAASRLGDNTRGFLSQIVSGGQYSLVAGKMREAAEIVDRAILQVSQLRGRLGAFERNTLQTNVNQLQITLENLISAESVIRDTDFAAETSRLTRSQILVNAGTSVLALANATPQTVLSLLGG